MSVSAYPVTRRTIVIVVLALCLFARVSALRADYPSAPVMSEATVVDANTIRLSWSSSVDAAGHAITYDIYRAPQPILNSNVDGMTPFTTTAGTTIDITPTATEVTQKYVWYYAIRARDVDGLRTLSKPLAANPHTYRLGTVTNAGCAQCHDPVVHGAINDRSAELCYACHGRADENVSAPLADKSTLHVRDDFFDYPSQTAGSRHRNAFMSSVSDSDGSTRDCNACHRSHLSPYYYTNAGLFDAAQSHNRLLVAQTGWFWNSMTSSYVRQFTAYARLSDPKRNYFCFACHGTDSATMAINGGPAAYDASGGEHNVSGYDTETAHGSRIVSNNDTPATNPAIQCLACHNEHASATTRLIDYRQSGTTNPNLYAGANICFACHSASSTEAKVAAGYAKPFSWNNRDVQAEFNRASAHPFTTTDTAQGVLSCTNCHNTHYVKRNDAASTDPAVTGGYWELARVSDPDNTKLGITGGSALCLRCHDGSAPVAHATSLSIVPYTPVFRTLSAITSPYFPGWNKAATGLAFADSGHATTTGQKAQCYNCHDPHASDFTKLTAWTAPTGSDLVAGWAPVAGSRANTTAALSREENLCFQCHGNGSVGRRATGARNVASRTALPYSHSATKTTGIHSDEENAGNLAYSAVSSKRHAECVDCHDPHAARRVSGSPTHTVGQSTAGGAVYGAWGAFPGYGATVDTSNWITPTAASFVPTRVVQSSTSFEAYLCFKCHSASTTLNTAVYTDQAREFNPSNFSEHNVLGQSVGMDNAFTFKDSAGTTVTRTWNPPAANTFLTAAWDTNSKMTCTDCHDGFKDTGTPDPTTLARGPHGSTVQWLIDPDYVNWSDTSELVSGGSGMSPSNIICAKCHTNLETANTAHSNHDGRGASGGYCRYCHVKIPHGWKRPRMLGYTTDPLPYRTNGIGLLRISAQNHAPNTWASTGSCASTGCSKHTNANVGAYWP